MPYKRGTRYALMGALTPSYADRVLSYGPIAYWPLWETSGTVAESLVTPAQNGTYARAVSTMGTQTGIGDGNTAPVFDGTNDRVNIYSTAIAAAFNGSEGAICGWAKIPAAAWVDSTQRCLMQLGVDGTYYIRSDKISTARTWRANYSCSPAENLQGLLNPTSWFHFAARWSKAADEFKAWINGVQFEPTKDTLGTWVGTIASDRATIGAANNSGTNSFSGSLAHIAVFGSAVPDATIEDLAKPPSLPPPIQKTITTGPAILLTFDDAGPSVLAEAFPHLRAYGIKSTFYLIGTSVAASQAPMYNAGWDLANHTETHANLSELTQAQIETELSDCVASLTAQGFTRATHHVAYPGGYGDEDEDVLAAMAAQSMLTGRTTLRDIDETIPLADPYYINCDIMLGVDTSLAQAKAWVDEVISTAKIGISFAHQLVETATTSTEWGIADFRALVDYIVAKRVPTLTICELYTLHDTGTVTVRVPNTLPP